MADSEAKKRWIKENTTKITIKINHNTDKDILEYLKTREEQGLSLAGAFREALKEKIAKEQAGK